MQFIQSKFSLILESTILEIYIYIYMYYVIPPCEVYMCPSKRKPTLQVKSYYWDN